MANRPDFFQIKTYEAFCKYYWYRKELSQICRRLGYRCSGTKQELIALIKAYFAGEVVKSAKPSRSKAVGNKAVKKIALDSPLLACGFAFNQTFRAYFAEQTGIEPFKFTADMATAWRKVKEENDWSFTLQDMLDLYEGKSHYAKYDNRACQWNQFYKDFCADKKTAAIKNKMKAAAILWREVRDSDGPKVYSSQLWDRYSNVLGND
ncbi:SAP domain-containing protein [Streptococcus ratti]|uniref:Cytoplasmic protein n=1 Tax=Streptococcus ratti FA-1 = DSM 20564 TaxID=699248 RepID=A0ABP2QWA1_STRRT|nr:SAP domain-containing protein [Streptococcus ratti]EJN93335.1 hypothetical protein SRA_02326 [Streptococcus ratti FA-1 = DSM 20564]EMP68870.1 hypothetical protein D822_09032 [Streptococcus ratti FA-1 = DSM 20564]QEY07232.1 hypothetical protein FY406_06095 [Streptococcus ratti]VEI59665.1 cytoplasmic protein [Streptococcus mutans]